MLLTRFSAVLRHGQSAPDEDWLYYRLGFFLDACLASVRSQRGAQPFDWLVLFDDRCSEGFRADVEQLADGTFTPIWTHESFRRDSFAEHVAERTSAPYLITTRIDSDDALAVDFMAAVQRQFAEQERLFVNFPRGIQIDRSGAVYRSDILSSPFLSLIEKRVEGRLPDTVFVTKHARARGHGPLREVRSPVMWAQVLHGTNLSNIVNGTRTSPRVVAERFDFDLGYDAHVTGRRLRTAQATHLGQLVKLWSAHPGELTKWAEASARTLRGTHERPQEDGAPTLSDKVQQWEQDTRTRLRHQRWHLTERANRALPGRARVVSGDPEEVLRRDKVVVLAEWSRSSTVRPDALRALSAYAEAGYGTLVVAARDPWTRLRRQPVPRGTAVLRRPNLAYDFGSWRDALSSYPQIAAKELVILTNDSLIGPLGSIDELLRRIESSKEDVWAPTSVLRPRPHLQSYLLAFRGGVLAKEPLRGFFADIRPLGSKREVVETYEFGLTQLIDERGLTWRAGWSHAELGLGTSVDIPLSGWQKLLDAGFPFIKRTLLSHPGYAHHRAAVEQVVSERCCDQR
ncbi:glycosyltransferase [Ornithinimicrobium panacihumi]|uniref:glycosyltransferase n=1 Tax=Ornithinimicrobium panacihumi TaxID=2008449 RepID=UPI003F8C07B8